MVVFETAFKLPFHIARKVRRFGRTRLSAVMRESEHAEQRAAVARIGKHHVLRRLDPPIAAAARDDYEDQAVGLMLSGRVGGTDG